MHQSTNSKLEKSSKIFSALTRFIKKQSSPASRQKVFFDSPGFLEQSQHWGGMGIWTIVDWFSIQKTTREKNLEKLQPFLY